MTKVAKADDKNRDNKKKENMPIQKSSRVARLLYNSCWDIFLPWKAFAAQIQP